jgi:hypothetical protein
VDWVHLHDHKPPGEVTFQLRKDVPIKGRVVNTEGKPVAGVSVSATSVFVPRDDNLDALLAEWLREAHGSLASPRKRLYFPLDGVTGAVATDQAGRFTLHGAGAGRIALVTFAGGGVARTTPYVITRPGFDPKPYNDVLLREEYASARDLNRFLGLYPPSLTFVAEAGKTVEGVVKDARSGKPVPGCRLFAQTGYGDRLSIVSDAAGKYRFDGLPKNARGYQVHILPPTGTAYLRRFAHAADTAGYAPVRLDIHLTRGGVVRGRVADRQTGRGVAAAIRFAPLPDNPFFGSRPGFDGYRRDRVAESTDSDGRFQLTTIPGKTLVLAHAYGLEKVHGEHMNPFRSAVPDPEHRELFRYDKDSDSWMSTTAGNGLERLDKQNAVKVIDVKEGAETTVELFVDRGLTGRVEVQDAAGNPLAGAWIAGLTDQWPITFQVPEPTVTILALDAEKPRQLVVFHAEKQLGGTVLVRAGEKEPVAVRLVPLGKVTGRLLDAEGQPFAGAELLINFRNLAAGELHRFANPSGKPAVSDKDGRFTLTGIVPGVSFGFGIRKGKNYFGWTPKFGTRQLKPRESLDLGDRTVELLR